MDLHRQLRIIRTWLPLLVASAILAGIAGFLLSNVQPKVYEGRATLIVGGALTGVNPDYNQLLVSQQLSTTYATVATTRPLLTKVIDRLGLPDTPEQLSHRVSASTVPDSTLLDITARDGDAGRAAAIANTLSDELINASPAVQGQQTDVLQSIDEDLNAVRVEIRDAQAESEKLSAIAERTPAEEARLQTLQGRLVSLRSTFATLLSFSTSNASNLLSVVQPAFASANTIEPRPLLSAVLAAMVAFLVASMIAFGTEYFDDAIKTAEQVHELVGLPTLASVMRMKGTQDRAPLYRLAPLLYPRSAAAESYRALRTNVEFMSVDAPIRTLLITSAVPSEGKTVTAANLAVVFAQGGRRVLLVDADLRKPGVHEIFGLPNASGLTNLLRREGASIEAIAQATEQERLHVLGTGPIPPNPAELLGSQRMRALIPTLAANYDLLVIDSPPLEAFTDSAVLSSFLDATILVVQSKRGRRALVRRAREALAKANANVIGIVLNSLSDKGALDFASYYGAGSSGTSGGVTDSATVQEDQPRTPGQRGTGREPDAVLPSVPPK